MYVLAVVSAKGGAGKTTVAAGLAGALASASRRVLAIDVDPQGGLGAALGAPHLEPGLYDVLLRGRAIAEAIQAGPAPGLDLLPAEPDLAGADVELREQPQWRARLAEALQPIADRYSYVVLDTPPGVRVLSYAAVSAATAAIVVCPPELLAYRSLPDVFDLAESIGRPILGVVPNVVPSRPWRQQREIAAALADDYGKLLLPPIPRRADLLDAAQEGQPITVYRPNGASAAAFAELAKEVMKRAKNTR